MNISTHPSFDYTKTPPALADSLSFFDPNKKQHEIAFPRSTIIDWNTMVGDWCVLCVGPQQYCIHVRDGGRHPLSKEQLQDLSKMVESYENNNLDLFSAIWIPENTSKELPIVDLETYADQHDKQEPPPTLARRIISCVEKTLFTTAMFCNVSHLCMSLCLPFFWSNSSQSGEPKLSKIEAQRILNIPPGSTIQAVRNAYHKCGLQSHPDKGGKAKVFIRCTQAFETLSKT
jgi:hypothetical protein